MTIVIGPYLRHSVAAQPYALLFATISGALLYGFPSPESDSDFCGARVLPLGKVVSLDYEYQRLRAQLQVAHEASSLSERYLVFHGPRTALIDADVLKMSFPVTRESGITSVEFSSDFKWGLGTKKDGQYLGVVELPENRKEAE
jgi:hypothetical protein